MPLYEYQCLTNGHTFEVRHPITQDPVTECPLCGSPVRRIIHPVGIVFKGGGFYATDSRAKSAAPGTKRAEGGDSKASAGETQSPSDAKSKPDSSPPAASGSTEPKPAAK